MAQTTKGQTEAGTARKKTERVLVHQKGGRPDDHLEWPWMDGIPSNALARTAVSPEPALEQLEWSNSKVHPCTQAICSVHVTKKTRTASWSQRSLLDGQNSFEGSRRASWQFSRQARISGVELLQGTSGPAGRWLPRVPRKQAEEVPHHQRLWEGGFCCGIANCHHERCDPTGFVITTVFALGVIRLVW